MTHSRSVRGRQRLSSLVLGVLAFGPMRLTAQQAADHVALGIAAEEAHDLRTALEHYQTALAQDSSNYDANWRGAMVLLTLGEQTSQPRKSTERDSLYRLAERYAARAVEFHPSGADGHFAYAAS